MTLGTLSGCSADNGADVASMGGGGESVDGYVNQATADYATCLEGLGLVVAAMEFDEVVGIGGYAEIDGAQFLVGESGVVSDDTDGQAIAVDGEDRDGEIRSCYADHPGAKDILIDMRDLGVPAEAPSLGDGISEAGAAWAQCARDNGASVIEDPDAEGFLIIPETVTLAMAEDLAEKCSAPMAEDRFLPRFDVRASVEAEVDGQTVRDSGPFHEALNAPFMDSEQAKKYREEHPEEFDGE
ncbi:hypothetical protein ACFS27_03780 [Promicromonospora vindobonensis]|uniref:Uncharacterized protein n=1 Tax=Promicromonospora vindobonensis TaxID=195748 RepID=A0ABW5VM39_9MICO